MVPASNPSLRREAQYGHLRDRQGGAHMNSTATIRVTPRARIEGTA
jgi:hypothetical protein